MSNDDSSRKDRNPVNIALREVFGPLVKQSSKLPAPLAYGTATVTAIVVIVLLGAVIPHNLIWLIGIIILVCLIAFVFIDWDTRRVQTRLENVTNQDQRPHAKSSIDLRKTVAKETDVETEGSAAVSVEDSELTKVRIKASDSANKEKGSDE